MKNPARHAAPIALLLILPAAFFMAALLVREIAPLHSNTAQTAETLVMWYAARLWTLWLLLLALPRASLVTGSATLLSERHPNVAPGAPNLPPTNARPANYTLHSLGSIPWYPATRALAATTLTAAAILVIVVLHMLAN